MFKRIFSWLLVLIPITILYPFSHSLTYWGMSSTGSWKSQTMVMTQSPVTCSIP